MTRHSKPPHNQTTPAPGAQSVDRITATGLPAEFKTDALLTGDVSRIAAAAQVSADVVADAGPLAVRLNALFESDAPDASAHILWRLSSSPSPARAWRFLCAFLERLEASSARTTAVRALTTAPDTGWAALLALFAQTEAFSNRLLSHLDLLPAIIDAVTDGKLPDRATLIETAHVAILNTINDEPDETRILYELRRFKTFEFIRAILLDVLDLAPLEMLTQTISDIADAELNAAIRAAERLLASRFGTRPAGLRFCVLAFGKLGARELNYSSDIDLAFIVNDAVSGMSGRLAPTDETLAEYAPQFARTIIRLLDKATSDGFVFRVDMRLRPYGSSSPLAATVSSAIRYYHDQGRTWERQALLKVRPCAGDVELGYELLSAISDFIHPGHLTTSDTARIVEMKHEIERQSALRATDGDDVKVGAGGIRDIEFSVQILQLLYGGKQKAFREPNTLVCIEQLMRHNVLSIEEAGILRESYIYLRRLEHRIQILNDIQSHRVPDSVSDRADLQRRLSPSARRLSDIDSAAALIDKLNSARRDVRGVFQAFFVPDNDDMPDGADALTELLSNPTPDRAAIIDALGGFSLADIPKAADALIRLRVERSTLLASPRARTLFGRLAPALLKEVAAAGDADLGLLCFERIVDSIGARAGVFQLLLEQRRLLRLVAQICAWSEMLTRILERNPGMFDEIIETLSLDQPIRGDTLRAELNTVLTGGDVGPTLRAFKSSSLLRIGCRDLIYETGLDATGAALTALAEVILQAEVVEARRQVMRARGFSEGYVHSPGVIGLGKVGGGEMNYGSDLDVLFVCDPERHAGMMSTGDYLALQTEIAQKVIREMELLTPYGTLYELDTRLRPDGRKGALVTTLEGFKAYADAGRLSDAERIALTRARPVAGHEHTCERTMHAIHSIVFLPVETDAERQRLAAAVLSMREKLEASADARDLKRGKGGTMDIEFICRYMQLREAWIYPKLRRTNTAETLELLARYDLLESSDARELLDAWRFLQALENRIRIVHGTSDSTFPTDSGMLDKLARRIGSQWGITDAAALEARYIDTTRRVRALFNRTVS
ncbi:MAG: bifunctional [glutamate--ammonia ligase]-adenylyl-L-tyrosine phosphorylase/[glutamate--ammonia-ligase] adenylyltransferase [Planctomycetota bacterium]